MSCTLLPVRNVLLSLVLFLSGASALLFETLWLRLSGLVFGNSVWAAALILSSFMAGLALGSSIAASTSLGRLSPFKVYATLELAVAVLGCSLVYGLPLLGEWMRPVFRALWHYQALLNALRFSMSFLILLLPTTAMGLTLPVLLEAPLLKERAFRRSIGALYGWNTLGAVAGGLVGEAYLVGAFGLFGTSLAAASANCGAAGIAWLCSRTTAAPVEQKKLLASGPPNWRLLLLSFGAGAILLGLEVVWFRFMRLYVASTSAAFCIMLAVILSGIGLGSLISGMMPRRMAGSHALLPLLLALAGVATLLSYLCFPAPRILDSTFLIESRTHIAWLSFALMFPTALLSGILLPSIVTDLQREIGGAMNSAGLIILLNTTGAALGPLLTCFVLLPSMGFQWSLILFSVGYTGLSFLGIEKSQWSVRRPQAIALAAFVATIILVVSIVSVHRDETHFANARRPYESDGSRLVKRIEGTADTFQLLRRDLYREPYYYRLVTDAYSMSGTLPRSQRYMRLFAYLPLALRPHSDNALLLCYGVGVTADAWTRDPHLKHLDIVDTSKEVFALAGSYSGLNYSNPLCDPRVTTFVQDARFFLQATSQSYDVITGEPPPLKVAGTVNLYTEQFFSLMRDRLKGGGIATFWLPIYQLTTKETKAILRAFYNVFPNASVWASNDLDWIMMGIKGPLAESDEKAAAELWSNERMRSDLLRIGIEAPAQMSALFVMDGDEIRRITNDAEPLTDFYPKRLTDGRADLEATHRFAYNYFEHSAALRRFSSSSFIKQIWPNEWKRSLELAFFVRETRYLAEISGGNWMADLDFYLRRTRLRTPVLATQNSDEFRFALAQNLAAKLPELAAEATPDLIAGALAQRDLNRAIELLEAERNRDFTNPNDFFLLTYLYCLNDKVDQAEKLAASERGTIPKDWFMDWLWGDLQAEFGFQPPR